MKLEDELEDIFRGIRSNCGWIEGIGTATARTKTLIERYCKRQREICSEYALDGLTENIMLKAKLATEEDN